jgi:hypothetical protein
LPDRPPVTSLSSIPPAANPPPPPTHLPRRRRWTQSSSRVSARLNQGQLASSATTRRVAGFGSSRRCPAASQAACALPHRHRRRRSNVQPPHRIPGQQGPLLPRILSRRRLFSATACAVDKKNRAGGPTSCSFPAVRLLASLRLQDSPSHRSIALLSTPPLPGMPAALRHHPNSATMTISSPRKCWYHLYPMQ